MLGHLLKLTWKRKGRYLMLSVEILLAFMLVFAVIATSTRYWQVQRMTLGFQYDNVWAVEMLPPEGRDAQLNGPAQARMLQSLHALPQVEQAAVAPFPLFQNSSMRTSFALPGEKRFIQSDWLEVSDQFWPTLGMTLVAGRWPSEQDEGAKVIPAVLNQRMVNELFGGKAPLGQEIIVEDSNPKEPERYRVVGVIEDFRNRGDFMAPRNFVISRHSLVSGERPLLTILVRTAAGTPRAFEADLQRQLKLVRNDWDYRIAPLAELRSSQLAETLIPLKILAVIAGFLLLMVCFGLFGVLWQNTTRRIPEIGLRRALGATAGSIYQQIVAEQMLLSTLAMLGGLALLVQLPLTGVLGESLNWRVFGGATVLSMGVIYLISLLCALYPGWRASRLHPAAALHHE
ncbi:ABC transporter permease [Pseudoduganella violaceinigra]|uniref:ABC transporter permease n=1 Tax=Pseudoduganella violaceinigra TaxID=246602 RepID=UPI000415B20E|nr:ABC transporter permease [Pseudoduganella violaceinigra]